MIYMKDLSDKKVLPQSKNNDNSIYYEPCDVVIVGAGLAGLSAAFQLHTDMKQTIGNLPPVKNQKIRIFEAQNRVGGRVFSHYHHGHWLEQGALFINDTHKEILALVKTLGLRLEDRFSRSTEITSIPRLYFLQGKPVSIDDLENYFLPLFDEFNKRVSKQQNHLEQLDELTITEYVMSLDSIPTSIKHEFLELADCIFASEYGFHVNQLNACHLFEAESTKKRPVDWLTRHFGRQPYRIHSGNQALPEGLAASLPDDWLRYHHQVVSVYEKEGTPSDKHPFVLKVNTPNGVQMFETQQLLLCAPISCYHFADLRLNDNQFFKEQNKKVLTENNKITLFLRNSQQFNSSLLDSQSCKLRMGINKKLFLHFDRPVWRDEKNQQEFMSILHPNFRAWNGGRFEEKAYDGHYEDCDGYYENSIVTLFLSGKEAQRTYSKHEIEQLAHVFIKAMKPVLPYLHQAKLIEVIDGVTWFREPFCQGSYGGALLPGQWSMNQSWMQPNSIGSLHFAGSEWDSASCGYMEGAVTSGLGKGKVLAKALMSTLSSLACFE